MNTHSWLFVTSLVGLAISAAGLILLIPSMFGSGDQPDIWLVGGLVVLVAAFAAGTRRWRPPPQVDSDQ